MRFGDGVRIRQVANVLDVDADRSVPCYSEKARLSRVGEVERHPEVTGKTRLAVCVVLVPNGCRLGAEALGEEQAQRGVGKHEVTSIGRTSEALRSAQLPFVEERFVQCGWLAHEGHECVDDVTGPDADGFEGTQLRGGPADQRQPAWTSGTRSRLRTPSAAESVDPISAGRVSCEGGGSSSW